MKFNMKMHLAILLQINMIKEISQQSQLMAPGFVATYCNHCNQLCSILFQILSVFSENWSYKIIQANVVFLSLNLLSRSYFRFSLADEWSILILILMKTIS